MKGDNVIEAYCPICDKSVTQADLHIGFAKVVDGQYIHITHFESVKKFRQDLKITKALDDLFKTDIISNKTYEQVFVEISVLASRYDIKNENLKTAFLSLMCEVMLESRLTHTKILENLNEKIRNGNKGGNN